MRSEKGFSGMKDNPQSTGKENQERSHLSLTQEQLYELVWSKPMQHLAKDYGASDRAMAKCVLVTRFLFHQGDIGPERIRVKRLSGHRFLPLQQKKNQNRNRQNPSSKNLQRRKPISLAHGKIEKRRLKKLLGIIDADY
jgi:hypothetical protein